MASLSYMRTGGNTGLGDYVHLKKQNYLNYGFFRSNKSGTHSQNYKESIAYAYNNLKNMAKETKMGGDVIAMEQMLTDVYRQNWVAETSSLSGVNLTNIEQQENELANAIKKQLPNHAFNRKDMTVVNQATLQSIGEARYKRYIGKEQGSIRKSTLIKIEKSLLNILSFLRMTLQSGQCDPQVIKAKRAEVLSYSQIIRSAIMNLNSQGRKSIPIRTSKGGDLDLLGSTLVNISHLRVNMGQPTMEEIGTTGELGVLAGLYVIDNKIDFTADQLIGGLVGGKGQGSANRNYAQRSPIYAHYNIGDEKFVDIRTTQDTVDIEMRVNNTGLLGVSSDGMLRASVKNYYNFSKGVNLISSVSLETILGLTGNAFANHYLNRIAEHEDGVVNTLPEGDNVVAYALAVRAITGRRYASFSKLSNYLITIERSKHRIKVYNSYDILERISPRPERFDYSLVNITGLPIRAGSFANIKHNAGAEGRITQLMTQVRAQKLSMSLTPAFFN